MLLAFTDEVPSPFLAPRVDWIPWEAAGAMASGVMTAAARTPGVTACHFEGWAGISTTSLGWMTSPGGLVVSSCGARPMALPGPNCLASLAGTLSPATFSADIAVLLPSEIRLYAPGMLRRPARKRWQPANS